MGKKGELHIIVAMTRDRVIGYKGGIPWKLQEDMALFRNLTTGNILLMGRKTFQSIGQPLSGRVNIVVSSTLQEQPGSETLICESFESALLTARQMGQDIFCIGGAENYRQALRDADWLHISWVNGEYDGDVFFPQVDFNEWQDIEEKVYPGFTYVSYRRK